MGEQELDLRPYLSALLRRWRLILGFTLAVALVAALATAMMPSRSMAIANVLIIPSTSQVTLDPRFSTRDATLVTNATTQRQALVGLARSVVLETRVVERLGLTLANAGEVLDNIEVNASSDLLTISALADTNDEAVKLAETWAGSFEELVNELYSGAGRQTQQLQAELDEAQQRYDESQRALEVFLAEGELVRAEQEVQRLTGVLEGSSEAQRLLYTQFLTRTNDLSLILEDARTLRAQVAVGAEANFGDSLAALSLRARAAGGGELPVDLRFDSTAGVVATRDVALSDLDALLTVLQEERDRLLQQAEALGEALASGDGSAIGLDLAARERFEQDLASATSRLASVKAREELFTQRLGIASNSIEVLQVKLDELRIAEATSQITVRFVGVSPLAPRSTALTLLLSTVAASIVGLVFAVLLVIALEIVRQTQARLSPAVQPSASERVAERLVGD